MNTWWLDLERRARIGLVVGIAGILLLMAAAAWWLLRPDQAVLFADLRAQDAALMASELDKLKVPYAVADNGSTLLVERAQVHATRMKLMGKDLPLHGAVGLELFNNSDFGMTEFAQKVNYQRALQGELTRTILAFPEVQDVRVHLALPEQGLFKQPATRPKAAVTLTLRPGRALRAEQVSGIQRLVAAAVPGLVAQEVTLVDQQGVALSRVADAEGDPGAGSGRLDLKRETENYLSRKAGAVLERAFGPGQALASVDATLNMEQVRVTTEDVIAAPDSRGGTTGVLVRERESARDGGAPELLRGAEARGSRGNSTQRDAEYQAGRRVEQVVSQPGSIRRLQVVAVLRPALDGEQQEQVRRLVAAAVGASFERGDTVVVQSFVGQGAAAAAPEMRQALVPSSPAAANGDGASALATAGLGLVAVALVAVLFLQRRAAQRKGVVASLDEGQRRLALRKVEAWLEEAENAQDREAAPFAAAGQKP
ncbi:flagellar M-ring protein FliF [Ramlibacter sp. XY19]|uniref:flagellar basal-body MS-ring/collar protein FliF n=1 Tax=Ramlibacter paludis TaxID=2908000 RepID=UPI0023DB4FDC|nr:flagellar basal-body MS-ring/collar protein FliF [Ramlibacter paludis]MCG2594950.1 flagellar M-ring protein FliF [Ramlibacter paludis]